MKDLIINVSRETRLVDLSKSILGIDNENLQQNLVFRFKDEFVNGVARLEFVIDNEKQFAMLSKNGESYSLPVKNILTKRNYSGQTMMQLVITESEKEDGVPVFKSNIFYMVVKESINAETEAPDGYQQWIEIANAKLMELEEAIDDCNFHGNYAKEQGDYAKEKGEYAKNVSEDIEKKRDDGTFNGKSLEFIWNGTKLGIRLSGDTEYTFVDLKGQTGERGETGSPFKIDYTYASISEMESDFENVEEGKYAMISGDVEERDTAKLFYRGSLRWNYIADFSGSKGIKGETGNTPNIQIGTITTLNEDESATASISGTIDNPLLNLGIPRGRTGNTGKKGETGEKGDTGNGILNIEKKLSVGLVDTYQINYTDGTNATFDIKNGEDGNVLQQDEIDKLNSQVDNLVSIVPKKTAEGTDSLEYDDALNFNVLNGKFKGNEYQYTTEGYNLVNTNNLIEQTINGITFTPVYKNGLLEYINVNGTSTDRADYKMPNYITYQKGDYYISKSNNNNDINILLVNRSGYAFGNTYLSSFKFSLSENQECQYWIRIFANKTINNEKIYPQVAKEEKKYEPYTNGASPNPDYPREIETLGAYNEFNAYAIKNQNIIVENNGKNIKMPIATSGNGGVETKTTFKELCPNLKIGDVVYLYFSRNLSTRNNLIFLSGLGSGIGTWYTGDSKTITQEILNAPVIMYGNRFIDGETEQCILIDFRIVKEKNKQKPYLPYGCVGKKYTRKNLFDINGELYAGSIEKVNNGFKLTKNTTYRTLSMLLPQTLSIGSYKITGNITQNNTTKNVIIDVRTNTTSDIARAITSSSTGRFSIDITTTQEDTRVYVYIASTDNDNVSITIDDFMISKEGGDYEPYKEAIQYINLDGNEMLSNDEAEVDYKGNARLIKKWGKVVLDGSDTENYTKAIDNKFYLNKYCEKGKIFENIETDNLVVSAFSNRFKGVSWKQMDSIDKGWYVALRKDGDSTYLRIVTIGIETPNDLKSLLAQNPVILYYLTSTPEIIELPKVEPIKSFEGYNNVELLATMQPSYMSDTYTYDYIKELKELSGNVIEIGSGQTIYEGKVLPTIPVDKARLAYEKDRLAIPQILHWTLYGTENNLKIVSSDHIANEYSIDVLIHNQYHCEYKWTDSTTGNIIPNVKES